MDELMTVAEVAKKMRSSETKIRQMIECGQIVAINLAVKSNGRPRWMIEKSEVDRFIESRTSRRIGGTDQ
jgi:excisionase family DNA binding protein